MNNQKVSLVEEIILILLDEEKGTLRPIPNFTLHIVLAGAVLMELGIYNRVDSDIEKLIIMDDTPTSDVILDRYLQKISSNRSQYDIKFWLNDIADEGDELLNLAIHRLVDRGILGETKRNFFWVVKSKVYPTLDGSVERNAKLRLMSILYSNELPEQRDVVLFCLLDACDMFRVLLSPQEVTRMRPRISDMARLDLIGIQTVKLIREIQIAMVATHAPLF